MVYRGVILCVTIIGCYAQFPDPGCLEDKNLDQQCISPGTNVTCSGRGVCICGMCECSQRRMNSAQRYTGPFCECDDYSCPYYLNHLCGGPHQGACVCGKCKCKEGWTGDNCGCPTSVETCRTTTGKICNDVGICRCGICECDRSTFYRGPTCEECPTCPGGCQKHKNCADCVFGIGHYNAEECETQCPYVKVVRALPSEGWTECKFLDEDDCTYHFSYRYTPHSGHNPEIEVRGTRECPPPKHTEIEDIAVNISCSKTLTVLGLISCGILRWMTL